MGEHEVSLENMGNMENMENMKRWKTSTRWLKSHQKTSEEEKQAFLCWCLNKDIHCMFVEVKPRTVFSYATLVQYDPTEAQ